MKKCLPKISPIPIIEKKDLSCPVEDVFARFAKTPESVFLHSSLKNDVARYSFIGLNPFLKLTSKKHNVKIDINGRLFNFKGNPFDYLDEIIKIYPIENPTTFPFIAGGVGYFSYDLKELLEKLPDTAKDDLNLMDMYFVFYQTLLIYDSLNTNHIYVSILDMPLSKAKKTGQIIKDIDSRLRGKDRDVGSNRGFRKFKNDKYPDFKSNFSKKQYIKTIEKAQEYIKAGDIYQVCLSQRFKANWPFPAYTLYQKLNKINPSPFSAYLNFDKAKIISSSPELFLRVQNGIIETRPMKGTRPRGETDKKDTALKNALKKSAKDTAELVMIVDLERNDLGRISVPGSIKVIESRRIETYPTVFQTISVVSSKVKDNTSLIDIIKATFPGGSISGCPKIRAMEIIEELEPVKRGIYTGSIGYISFHNTMDLNIAIRTMVVKGKNVYFQTGGGITIGSDPQTEYEETLHKAKALIDSIESITQRPY